MDIDGIGLIIYGELRNGLNVFRFYFNIFLSEVK